MPPSEAPLSMADRVSSVDDELNSDNVLMSALESARGQLIEQRWQELLDKLIDWSKEPGQFDDDGWQSPTEAAIRAMCGLIREHLPKRFLPFCIVSSGEGGISMEFVQSDETATRLEIDSRGNTERLEFMNNKLSGRYPM